MKSNLRKALLCGVLSISGVVFAAPAGRPPEAVRTGKVSSISDEISRKYIGTISAVDDVALVPRVSGVIEKQQFANGDMVKKGQELFIIEDTSYVAARDSAEAKLAQCRAEYEFAKRNLARMKTLIETKATSESSFDEAVRTEATSAAAVKAAEAALIDAKNNLSYTKIISPIDGKTGRAAVSPGNYVTPGFGTLVTVVALDQMYVNFWMSMNDYLSLFGSFETLKKEAEIKIIMADGSEFPNKAKIVFLDNRVDKDTDTIRIRGLVKNKEMRLLPDSIVTVRVTRKDGEKAAVPVSSVLNNGKISFVYTLDDQNVAQVRPVELGAVRGKLQIITKGLKPGETIVFDGTHKVIPGNKVMPVSADTEKK